MTIGGSGMTYGTAASAIGGAAGGFAAGGIMGGNLQSALYGAVSGGITGGISPSFDGFSVLGRKAAMAALQGAVTQALGGKFRNGALPVAGSYLLGQALDLITPEAITLFDCAGKCVPVKAISRDGLTFLNGILNDLKGAEKNAFNIIGNVPDYILHNPSQGFMMDGLETFQDVFGNGSKGSRTVRSILQQASSDGYSIDLYAHSQGGAIARSAFAGTGGIPGITVTFVGSPVTQHSARMATGSSYGGFRANPNDFVPSGLGWNGGASAWWSSFIAIPRLFSNTNSPHSGYAYPPR
jgi:hypothetical protein